MKRQVSTGYTFTPGSSQLDLSGISGMSKGGLLAVLNVTTGAIVYAVGTPGFGATFASLVLTLQAPMAGMASGDTLAVIFDDGSTAAQDATVGGVTTALGTDGASPPALPGGSTGVRGWLRYLGSLLSGTITVGGTVAVSNLPATQAISAAALPLPAGAATQTTLASILTAIQSQRAESLWTDDTNAFFVRVDNAGAISWTDVSGNPASAPGTGARPVTGPSAILDKTSYQATAAATGYSIGDFIDHFVTTDPSTGSVIGHFWINSTTEAKLASAPASANISPVSILPTGASTAANQATANTSLAQLHTDLTAPTPAGSNVIGGVFQQPVTWMQTPVTLAAGTSAPLIAANANRKGLYFENTGSNPFTFAPGAVTVVAGTGRSLNPPSGTGYQGGSADFAGEVSTQAFSAVSTGGTTVIVWEGN